MVPSVAVGCSSAIFFRIDWTNKTIPLCQSLLRWRFGHFYSIAQTFPSMPIANPVPLSPPPEIFVRLFSLKSCSKSETEGTAGSNVNLTIEPKIWRNASSREPEAKIVSLKDATNWKDAHVLILGTFSSDDEFVNVNYRKLENEPWCYYACPNEHELVVHTSLRTPFAAICRPVVIVSIAWLIFLYFFYLILQFLESQGFS